VDGGRVVSHLGDGVTITDGALAQIVVAAAQQVEGVRMRRRKGLEPQDGRIAVSLAVPYGTVLPETARDVQAHVVAALQTMCGLEVAVDVSFDEVDAS
jgi:uncharacterized alkaline shock family protein YloU